MKSARKIRCYFAGQHTTTYSRDTGLVPLRQCTHRHRTQAGADRCAALHGGWITYAELTDGYVSSVVTLHQVLDAAELDRHMQASIDRACKANA